MPGSNKHSGIAPSNLEIALLKQYPFDRWEHEQCSLDIHNLCMNYWIKSIESMISHSFVQCRATDDSGCQEEGGSVFLSICQGIFQYWFIFINALFSLLKGCPVFIGKLAIFVFVFHSYYPKSLILNIVPGRSRKGGFPLQNEHKYWTSTNICPILSQFFVDSRTNTFLIIFCPKPSSARLTV